jgi:hypothetical protein
MWMADKGESRMNPIRYGILGAAALSAFGAAPRDLKVPAGASTVKEAPASPASFALVELFTSEGCSSCPPADALLAGLAAEAERDGKRIFPIAFHIDYWNSLGWDDPFSRPEFSERQERYARALRSQAYTPQMIVNGSEAFVGSNGVQAKKAIEAALAGPASVGLSLEPSAEPNGGLRVAYRANGHREGDVVSIALVESGLSVPVRRGENRGHTLRHENVVRAFRTARLDAAGAGSLDLEIPADALRGKTSLIAFVQKGGTLQVVGASRAVVPAAQKSGP